MLIGLTGKARSGKDTFAQALTDEYGFVPYAFGDKVKQTAATMFGVPVGYFYDDTLKEKVVEKWGISPREMAQKVGTECGRNVFFEDIWIRRIAQAIEFVLGSDCSGGVVITDVRFDNEAQWIKERGGHIVAINRNTPDGVRPHVSENGVNVGLIDVVVFNTGSIESLQQKAVQLVKNIEEYAGK